MTKCVNRKPSNSRWYKAINSETQKATQKLVKKIAMSMIFNFRFFFWVTVTRDLTFEI